MRTACECWLRNSWRLRQETSLPPESGIRATYRIARPARRDLQEISNYWTSEAGEDAALRVVGGIIETVITISHHPQAGVAADHFGERVRKFPAGMYMIIYHRPYSKRIEILHVFDGARHQAKAWRKNRS